MIINIFRPLDPFQLRQDVCPLLVGLAKLGSISEEEFFFGKYFSFRNFFFKILENHISISKAYLWRKMIPFPQRFPHFVYSFEIWYNWLMSQSKCQKYIFGLTCHLVASLNLVQRSRPERKFLNWIFCTKNSSAPIASPKTIGFSFELYKLSFYLQRLHHQGSPSSLQWSLIKTVVIL